ncbi:hypothetical protein HYS47_05040 [Candidatus Woesearchaeota archaeon]|nr:hypothetical protein [Candidatus Woesearchaeota archaeon]
MTGKTRRETLRLLGLGGLGLLVQGASGACSSRYAKPIRGPGSDVIYLPADELADTIKKKYNVCVGVADSSTVGVSYWAEDIRPTIQKVAVRAYIMRCGATNAYDAQELPPGFHMVWLAGQSFDSKGEEKGPAAMVFGNGAIDRDTLREIVERYGTLYENRTNLYRGKPIE